MRQQTWDEKERISQQFEVERQKMAEESRAEKQRLAQQIEEQKRQIFVARDDPEVLLEALRSEDEGSAAALSLAYVRIKKARKMIHEQQQTVLSIKEVVNDQIAQYNRMHGSGNEEISGIERVLLEQVLHKTLSLVEHEPTLSKLEAELATERTAFLAAVKGNSAAIEQKISALGSGSEDEAMRLRTIVADMDVFLTQMSKDGDDRSKLEQGQAAMLETFYAKLTMWTVGLLKREQSSAYITQDETARRELSVRPPRPSRVLRKYPAWYGPPWQRRAFQCWKYPMRAPHLRTGPLGVLDHAARCRVKERGR